MKDSHGYTYTGSVNYKMLFRQLLLSRKSVPATGIVSSNPKPNSLLPNVHNICAEGFNRVLRRPGESVLPAPVLPPLPWSASQRQLRTLEGESEDINKPLLWQLSHLKALEGWPLIVRENAPWLLTIILVCFRQSQTAAASFNVSQFSNTSKSFRWGLKRTSFISFRCKLVKFEFRNWINETMHGGPLTQRDVSFSAQVAPVMISPFWM